MMGDAPQSKNVSSSDPNSKERPRRKRKKHNNKRPRGEQARKRRKGRRNNGEIGRNSTSSTPKLNPSRRPKRRQRQAALRNSACHLHLVERCTWPQCNRSCPKLHNPFTGEEMDLIELLKSFGLDMASVAKALGIDLHTLDSMDPAELLSLLTQQAS